MSAPVLPCQPMPEPARQHSPLPWRVHGLYLEEIYCTDDGHQFMVADICGAGSTEQDTVNTAFIVEAVNSHATLKARVEELEAALRFIADGYDNHDVNHVDYRVRVYQVATEALEAKQ